MNSLLRFRTRCDEIIALGRKSALANDKQLPDSNANELFYSFKSSLESFVVLLYGKDHPHYEIISKVHGSRWFITQSYFGVLDAIKSELEGGWLSSIKAIVSAEIFSDFLEMAEHLLREHYKDSAAVMIGSVLEEHIRQLCVKNSIPIEIQKDGKLFSKKIDLLNSELSNANIYNKLDQKNVTAWLDLRNKAAHGKYNEYNQQQVELMHQAVLEFMTRNSI
jgi:hypothetical protein